MTAYEIYVFLLCFIVFSVLTILFTALVCYSARLLVRMIRSGTEDKRILAEYQKNWRKEKGTSVVAKFFTAVFCVVVFFLFAVSVYLKIFEEKVTGKYPVFRVVYSGSMSEKYEKNKYLFENDLNDQFDRFDLILTHALPDEFDLELYDVVVYQTKDALIIHRIVAIEEPNEKHPDHRLFSFQGDAVNGRDRYAVTYDQMRGIYRGERVPFVGSFVAFMQSPAGYLCVLLIVFGIVAIPLMEKKIEKEKWKRLLIIKKNGGPSANAKDCRGYVSGAPIIIRIGWSKPTYCNGITCEECALSSMCAYREYCVNNQYNEYRIDSFAQSQQVGGRNR